MAERFHRKPVVKELYPINEKIHASQVRLVQQDGEAQILPLQQAIDQAKLLGLDLVAVAPEANPPVCRIMDYNKVRFDHNKKQKEFKKKQKQTRLKEIRMHPKIDKHDLDFKMGHVKDFLAQGNKVKITVQFKGRQMAHTHLGLELLENVGKLLEEHAKIDFAPKQEGRTMFMLVSPLKLGKLDKVEA